MSEWLRDLAREAAVRGEGGAKLRTVEELREFFRQCDARESGTEPDWEAHRRKIDDSMREGIPDA